jgi:peptide-N4-(N-acetyl-beta-glucosaminyl)asparagine amidase
MDVLAKLRRPQPGVITKLLQSQNDWPNPEQSAGNFIRNIGNKCCWQAIGKARDDFEILATEIANYLDKNSEPLPLMVTWSMYMIGKTKQSSIPTIVFCCEVSAHRVQIKNMIKESGIMKQYGGIKLGHMPRPPDFDQLLPLAHGRDKVAKPEDEFQKHITWSPTMQNSSTSSVQGAVGQRILIHDCTEQEMEPREATIGGVIHWRSKYYYLTAGHAFRKTEVLDTTSLTGADAECEFDGQSDYEDDSVDANNTITNESEDHLTPESAGPDSETVTIDYISSVATAIDRSNRNEQRISLKDQDHL